VNTGEPQLSLKSVCVGNSCGRRQEMDLDQNRFLRVNSSACDSPSLQIFKTCLDKVLCGLL